MKNKTKPQTHTPKSDSFTPGPWKVEQTNAGWIGSKTKVRVSAEDGYVALIRRIRAEERRTYGVRGIHRSHDEVQANARLIAAAPELLKALKTLHEASADAYRAGRVEALAFVEAGNIIAKAEAR